MKAILSHAAAQVIIGLVWFTVFAASGAPKWVAMIAAAVVMQLGLIEARLAGLKR